MDNINGKDKKWRVLQIIKLFLWKYWERVYKQRGIMAKIYSIYY